MDLLTWTRAGKRTGPPTSSALQAPVDEWTLWRTNSRGRFRVTISPHVGLFKLKLLSIGERHTSTQSERVPIEAVLIQQLGHRRILRVCSLGLLLLLLLLDGLVGWCHLMTRTAGGRRHHHGLLVLAAVARWISSMASRSFHFGLINHICLSIVFLLCG